MDETRFPGESPPAPARRRWPRRLGMVALGVLALLGPWPVDNGSYEGSEYERRTLDRLAAMPGPTPPGPIRVGVAEVDLTPERPGPLAGFSSQAGKAYEKVDAPCSARALTVATGRRAVTILAADLLLINAEMARAVLDRAGLGADEVYFTATHTHGGPGGWGRHPLERLVAGPFDPDVLATLADRLADAVRRSRAGPAPAEMALVQAHPPGRQKNRVTPEAPTHDDLSALVFRPAGSPPDAPPLAILAVFGAHATVVRTDPPKLSADYPGALVAALKAKTGAGMVLFAAGAVGDAAPVPPPIPAMTRAARALGSMLADDLMAALPSARFSADVPIDRLRLAVDLPPVRLPFFSAWLRFSPAATWWIADRSTHLDALRIGPAVLVGFPGDEAGHLAGRVVEDGRRLGLTPVVTSFNGDYRGYFESSEIFLTRSCYETRWMNFYGPWLGEYLVDVGNQMVRKLAVEPDTSPPISLDYPAGPMALRISAGIALFMLCLAVAEGGDTALKHWGWWNYPAAAVVVGFTVMFLFAPDATDWSRFGLSDRARFVAVLPLLGTICWIALGKVPSRKAEACAWASLALVTATWPIVLAGAWSLLCGRPAATTAAAEDHQSKYPATATQCSSSR